MCIYCSHVYVCQCNKSFAPEGRYAEFYNDPAIGLLRFPTPSIGNCSIACFIIENLLCLLNFALLISYRSDRSGAVVAVQTSEKILYGKKAIVIAAGAWSGSLMRSFDVNAPDVPVKPRKVLSRTALVLSCFVFTLFTLL